MRAVLISASMVVSILIASAFLLGRRQTPVEGVYSTGCPDGSFMPDGSAQCFIMFNDDERTWEEGKRKCEAQGLLMAQPSDEVVAAALKDHVMEKYGDATSAWVGARGDGSQFVWQRDGSKLSNYSPLFGPGKPISGGLHTSEEACLGLTTSSIFPDTVYYTNICDQHTYTICEGRRQPPVQVDVAEEKHDQGCPSGFFMFDGSVQCFKLFTDVRRSWDDAKAKCEAEGLMIARPSDELAVTLRSYVLDTYGTGSWAWLDARGDGSKFMWQREWTELRSDNPLWYPESPEHVSSEYCVRLEAYDHWRNEAPNKVYSADVCWREYNTLCEVIRE